MDTYIMGHIADVLLDNTEVSETEFCLSCNKQTIRDETQGHSIRLTLQPGLSGISVQTLLDNFFSDEERCRTCDNCENDCNHKLSKTITSCPQTLVIVLGRYHNENSVTKKLHNVVYVNENLHVSLQSEPSKSDIKYEFKSAVCHFGDSAMSGHYVAMVKTGSHYICCNDSIIETASSDALLETAYILVYVKVTQDLPQFVGPFLSCFRTNVGLQQVLKDHRTKVLPQRKLEILSLLNSKGFDKDLQHKLEVLFGSKFEQHSDNQITVELFYEMFIKYLFYVDAGTGPALSSEYFEVPSKHIFMCSKCGLTDIQSQNQLMMHINYKIENETAFSDALKCLSGARVLTKCKCDTKDKKVLFCSLPSTLIFHVENSADMSIDSISLLDFKSSIESCYDLNSTRYSLKSILCKKGDSYLSVIKSPNGFMEDSQLSLDFDEKNLVTDLSQYDDLHLFYSKSVGVVQSFLVNKKFVNPSLNQLPILNIKLDRKLKKKPVQKKATYGTRISQSFIDQITGKTSWLTSDHINVYMKLLAKKSPFSIHVVDSCWYSEILLKNRNPQELQWFLYRLESKTVKWFDSRFIIIPINENGSHWTLAVIDTEKQLVFYCNSLGISANSKYVCFQIWRYMCLEALMHSGKILDKKDWSFILYSEDRHFPKQTDGSSCGVYVCTVARAIIFNCRLPDEPNLARFREIFAYEILEDCLLEGVKSLKY